MNCNHFWRAVDSTHSQCAKCGEIVREPCSDPECATLRSELERLQAALTKITTYDHAGDDPMAANALRQWALTALRGGEVE